MVIGKILNQMKLTDKQRRKTKTSLNSKLLTINDEVKKGDRIQNLEDASLMFI